MAHKPKQWRLGAQARLRNQGRETNPFTFPNANPKDNEPWSFWNHGWSWADTQLRTLENHANAGNAIHLPLPGDPLGL